ncbi:MAG TPA: antitoxin Xre/MbcA/ParS toxin-binding domain-containing protein [bacterium]|nr:antitoxin Xre/MbcA/ParS toxin-binding domain-containing protein [bacterium]
MKTIGAINDTGTRRRLTGSAIRGFLRLADVWGLTRSEQVDLLGASVSRQTLASWTGGLPHGLTLSTDQIMRISYLLGIYEALQRIWRRAPDELVKWIRRPRPEPPFSGVSPLDFMRAQAIPGLRDTRAYLDGVTGGPPSREDYISPPREAD